MTIKTSWLCALSLIVVALIAAIHVPFPFYNDQATFTLGALKLHQGAVMYVDFWDLKQPGIFFIYLFAGSLFGFSERGVHTFEALYWVAFAVVLIATLVHEFRHHWIVTLVPLLTIGMYYAAAGAWHLTQVESLAGFPLYVALWGSVAAGKSVRHRWLLLFIAGLAGAVVVLLKFLFIVIVFGIWMAVALASRTRPAPAGSAVGNMIAVACGFLVPLVVAIGYFSVHHALAPLVQTTFVIPLQMVGQLSRQGANVLLSDLGWFVPRFLPVILLAIVGAWSALRLPGNAFQLGLLAWIFLALLVIVVQTQSWWQYHFMLLFVPLGVLAAYGFDAALLLIAKQRLLPAAAANTLVFLVLLLLFFPSLVALARKAHQLQTAGFAANPAGQAKFYKMENIEYRQVADDSAFLKQPGSLPGDIWVIGNSTLRYYLTGRNPAVAFFFVPSSLLPAQIHDISNRFERSRPAYVFVPGLYAGVIQQRYGEAMHFLRSHYRIERADNHGTWYRRRPD